MVATGGNSPAWSSATILNLQLERLHMLPDLIMLTWAPIPTPTLLGVERRGAPVLWPAQPEASQDCLCTAVCLQSLLPQGVIPVALQYSPQGELCLLSSQHLAFTVSGSESTLLNLPEAAYHTALWSPVGSHILCISDSAFVLVHTASYALVAPPQQTALKAQPCFHPSGAFLAYVAEGGQQGGQPHARQANKLVVVNMQLCAVYTCSLARLKKPIYFTCDFSASGNQVYARAQHANIESSGMTFLLAASFDDDWELLPVLSLLATGTRCPDGVTLL